MHKPKLYKCSICGAEVPDLPMPVLKHQMSHVSRRLFARSAPEAAIAKQEIGPASSDTE
jgi:DNA-directed RNA polymerase subunit RPC12/RpoP